jgi:nucleotide-binding universal stress UspA family protein
VIHTILVAYDGSDYSMKAFDFAADLTKRYNAALYVLSVAQVPEFAEEVETEAIIEQARNHHRKLLHELEKKSHTIGVHPHVEIAVGHVAQQILLHAAQYQADLIVLGHRGKGVLDRWRLGSVSHRVISYAECAVTVVR